MSSPSPHTALNVAAVLGHGDGGEPGLLARVLPGYEPRPAQVAMAEAVARALSGPHTLLCEAGTGTGKTLAYLVPALLSGLRVVISTGTRQLQDQLFQKDLPALQRVLSPFTAVRLKGIGNYLCLRRFHQALAQGQPSDVNQLALPMLEAAPRPQDPRLAELATWQERTLEGDRAELANLADDAPEWLAVAASSETRLGSACSFFERCFVTRARRAAQGAELVIVNHHLLCADLAVRARFPEARLLPAYEALICDEAHLLEDVAADYFGLSISAPRLHGLLADARRFVDRNRDQPAAFLASIHRCTAEATTAGDRLFQSLAARTSRAALRLVDMTYGDRLFQSLAARTGLPPGDGEGLRAGLHAEHVSGEPEQAGLALDSALEALQITLPGARAQKEEAALLARRAQALRDDLAQVLEGAARPGGSRVYWAARTASGALALHATPSDVGELLQKRLYAECPALVLTSATLAPGGDFAFARQRLGISTDAEELRLPSPFDYRRQALLYLPDDLPEPAAPGFLPAACERIFELIEVTRGRAFLLFTSHARMRGAFERLRPRLLGRYPLFVQGEAPRHVLTARFAASIKDQGVGGVLFATTSFWQGVDVAGEALELVVMDKLPFQPPDDPVLSARARRLAEDGADPFAAYQVPQAALALAQGFGRLIRHRADRGIVALLDRRAATRGYGPAVLAGLPPDCPRETDFQKVVAFWRGVTSAR